MSRKRRKKSEYEYLTRKFPSNMRKTLVWQFFGIVMAFVVLLGAIIRINAEDGSLYTRIVLNQQSYTSNTLVYERGEIQDKNGTVLASSERVYNVILDVKALLKATDDPEKKEKYIEQTTQVLVDVFNISEDDIEDVIENSPESQYKVMAKLVDFSTAQRFNQCDVDNENYPYLYGVWLEEDYKRNYTYSNLASSLIGYANTSNVGIAGLELLYSNLLNGLDGRKYGYYNEDSSEYTVREAQAGCTLVTSIDQTVQNIVEKKIELFNETYKDSYTEGASCANLGVLIMNPNTGELIASADFPNYDLNEPSELSDYYSEEDVVNTGTAVLTDSSGELPEECTEEDIINAGTATLLSEQRNNFVVTNTYEPGSTVKPFTIAMALEMGLVDGTETYECTGHKVVNGVEVSCVNRSGHGTLTLEEGLAVSCNVVMMEVAEDIGVNAFTEYQKLFGFGQTTGIDLPNETSAANLIYKAENMTALDLATNSFGQNFNTTMIQVATGMSALINGGYYYEPHVVTQVQDASGSIVENIEPTLLKTIVSEETSRTLCDYLLEVVENGTGHKAAVEGYEIGGKTGTAEKLPRGQGTYLVSFIGAVPMHDPELLIYVVVDEPNAEEQANSAFAQTLASDILAEVLPYMGIEHVEGYEPENIEVDTEETDTQEIDAEETDTQE